MQRVLQRSYRQALPSRVGGRSSTFLSSGLRAPLSTSPKYFAHSDYGSGDPKSGPNPSEHIEHPGPAAPDTTGSSSSGGSGKGKPTIHSEQQDGSSTDESVRKHNEEMDKRAAKSHDKDGVNDPKDKVHKGYWKGEGDQ